MVEWVTILYALIVEATVITRPDLEMTDRFPFLKTKKAWVLPLAIAMLALSISYFVFSVIWFMTDSQPIRFCGGIIMLMSFVAMMQHSSGIKRTPLMLQIDAVACFVCVSIIAYARLKGW